MCTGDKIDMRFVSCGGGPFKSAAQGGRRHIAGVREVDFIPIVRQMVRAQRHRAYRYTRDLVASLRRRGYYLIAVSHSPRYMVDDFARELGFDEIYGRVHGVTMSGRDSPVERAT
jgi:phosphoserine phosphatase